MAGAHQKGQAGCDQNRPGVAGGTAQQDVLHAGTLPHQVKLSVDDYTNDDDAKISKKHFLQCLPPGWWSWNRKTICCCFRVAIDELTRCRPTQGSSSACQTRYCHFLPTTYYCFWPPPTSHCCLKITRISAVIPQLEAEAFRSLLLSWSQVIWQGCYPGVRELECRNQEVLGYFCGRLVSSLCQKIEPLMIWVKTVVGTSAVEFQTPLCPVFRQATLEALLACFVWRELSFRCGVR